VKNAKSNTRNHVILPGFSPPAGTFRKTGNREILLPCIHERDSGDCSRTVSGQERLIFFSDKSLILKMPDLFTIVKTGLRENGKGVYWQQGALKTLLKITRRLFATVFCLGLFTVCAAPTSRPQETDSTTGGAEAEMRRKIAQMLLVGFRGTELTEDNHIYRDIAELGIGGVLLFDYDMPFGSRPRNIESKEQLTRLCTALQNAALQNTAPAPLFIAIDQEGGRVNRLRGEYGFPAFISARDMAADSSGKTTKAQAETTAALLADMGINLNFAPCVDLDLNPANPIIGAYGRSFSADPAVAARHAALWINAHRRRGVVSAVKHFPGHGSSAGDTHRGQVDITGLWQETELEPYRLLLGGSSGGLSGDPGEYLMVMTSHVFNAGLDPRNPATLSAPVLSGLLREQFGWQGIIVSDDMDMAAIKANYGFEEALERAVNAGVDLICLSNNGGSYDPALAQKAADALCRSVEAGRITEERIEESWNRIMAIKRTLGCLRRLGGTIKQT
jgi:beta-N-acetylhexosaminidase